MKCKYCNGDGWILTDAPTSVFRPEEIGIDNRRKVRCVKCNGTGNVEEEKP